MNHLDEDKKGFDFKASYCNRNLQKKAVSPIC